MFNAIILHNFSISILRCGAKINTKLLITSKYNANDKTIKKKCRKWKFKDSITNGQHTRPNTFYSVRNTQSNKTNRNSAKHVWQLFVV